MPETAQKHCYRKIAAGIHLPIPVSAKRDVEVVSEPR